MFFPKTTLGSCLIVHPTGKENDIITRANTPRTKPTKIAHSSKKMKSLASTNKDGFFEIIEVIDDDEGTAH